MLIPILTVRKLTTHNNDHIILYIAECVLFLEYPTDYRQLITLYVMNLIMVSKE